MLHKWVFMSEITKAFLQIEVVAEDRDSYDSFG